MGLFKGIKEKYNSFLDKTIVNLEQKIAKSEEEIRRSKEEEKAITLEMQKALESDLKKYYKNVDIGLYFFDKIKLLKNKDEDISDYLYLLGCSCQGREREANGIIDDFKKNEPDFYKLIESDIPRIIRMLKISKIVEDSDLRDMKISESIGEYCNRRLRNYKSFMIEFDYFYKMDFDNIKPL